MQHIRTVASHMPGTETCWQRNWPRAFLVASLAAAVLCFLSIIFGLIGAVLRPRQYILSIYCLIFALLGLSAEMRQFGWCRRVVYTWMRFFYFLTYYKARGVFYILYGILLFTSSVLDIIAAVVTVGLGIVMLLVALIVDLPVFEDPREQQQKEEDFRNYYGGPAPFSTASAPPPPPAAAAPPAAAPQAGYGVQPDTPAQFAPAAHGGSQAMTQKSAVPPSAVSAAPASAAPAATNYRENEFRQSSDDEPVRNDDASGVYSNASPSNANPYETYNMGGGGGSGQRTGPAMFEPSTVAARSSSGVAPPLREAGVTRGGNTESAIRRDFAAAFASNSKDDDDLR